MYRVVYGSGVSYNRNQRATYSNALPLSCTGSRATTCPRRKLCVSTSFGQAKVKPGERVKRAPRQYVSYCVGFIFACFCLTKTIACGASPLACSHMCKTKRRWWCHFSLPPACCTVHIPHLPCRIVIMSISDVNLEWTKRQDPGAQRPKSEARVG